MNLQVLDPKTLTLDTIRKSQDSLYCINKDVNGLISMKKFSNFTETYPDQLIVMISSEEPAKAEERPEVISKPEPERKPKRKDILDYKFSGSNSKNNINIEFRPPTGGIRVNFKNREDAEEHYEYFRERFYDRELPYITVGSIYEDLGIDKEVIEKLGGAIRWGYPTIKGGLCTYISDVRKTKDTTWWGFTLKKPYIVNGMTESKWYAKKQEEQNASIRNAYVY